MEQVVRTLEDGPDYTPAWRYAVVQAYLSQILAEKNPAAKLQEILFRERDVFVRQLLRHRFDGSSVNESAFRYALGCQTRNRDSGAASTIKAMLVADRTLAEIAAELGTRVVNIGTFAKVFFDVRRYLDNEAFLRRVCLDEPAQEMTQAEAARERRWLSAAFHRGWEGVEQVVLRRTPHTAEAIEKVTRQLEAALATRALEYVEALEAEGIAPSEADLKRYTASRAAASRQPETNPTEGSSMIEFISSFHGAVLKKAATSEDPALQEVWRLHQSTAAPPPEQPLRRRKRFNN
jgi:hypothetical protein